MIKINHKPIFIVNITLLLVLLGVNFWIYTNRDNGFAFINYAGENDVYTVSENDRISSISNPINDSIYITINQNDNTKQIPLLLSKGFRSYSFFNSDDSIRIDITYTTTKTYQSNGRERQSVVEINKCSVPISSTQPLPIKNWQQYSIYSSVKEIESTKQFIADSLYIELTDSGISKVKKIALYIL